jgi:O-antigen ligase
LVFWPWAEIAYEIPKVLFVYRWVEILGFIGVFASLTILKKEKLDSVLVYLIMLFCFFVLLSSLLGVDFNKSLVGNYYRKDGIFTLSHLIIIFFFLVLFFEKEWLRPLFVSISAGSAMVSIITIIDAYRAFVLGDLGVNVWDNALGSTFGNPNFLAGYLVVTLPSIIFLLNNKNGFKEKFVLLSAFFMQVIAILLTRSWSGVLGILIFFLIFFLTRKRKNVAFIFLGIVGMLVFWLAFGLNYKSMQKAGIVIAEGRERIFVKGILAFLRRPVFGWGWANFDYAFESVDWPIEFNDDIYVDKAHSNFLEILVTTGAAGFLIYLFIILRAIVNLLGSGSIRNPILWMLVLYIIHSQTNVISISEELLFWIILGIGAKKIMLKNQGAIATTRVGRWFGFVGKFISRERIKVYGD